MENIANSICLNHLKKKKKRLVSRSNIKSWKGNVVLFTLITIAHILTVWTPKKIRTHNMRKTVKEIFTQEETLLKWVKEDSMYRYYLPNYVLCKLYDCYDQMFTLFSVEKNMTPKRLEQKGTRLWSILNLKWKMVNL